MKNLAKLSSNPIGENGNWRATLSNISNSNIHVKKIHSHKDVLVSNQQRTFEVKQTKCVPSKNSISDVTNNTLMWRRRKSFDQTVLINFVSQFFVYFRMEFVDFFSFSAILISAEDL